jgi:H+-transporting ATPase
VLALHPNEFDKGEDPYAWPRFWSMPVIALILITLLNDGTIISIAYDHVSVL